MYKKESLRRSLHKGDERVYGKVRLFREYAAIDKLYMEEEKRLMEYREKCKDEAFDLMKKYFFSLWD